MATYRLAEAAKYDMARIYRWGVHRFGEAQADRYFDELFANFDRIAENPERYPKTEIREGYRLCATRGDTIYFRVKDGVVEIMAIIGRQDTEDRL